MKKPDAGAHQGSYFCGICGESKEPCEHCKDVMYAGLSPVCQELRMGKPCLGELNADGVCRVCGVAEPTPVLDKLRERGDCLATGDSDGFRETFKTASPTLDAVVADLRAQLKELQPKHICAKCNQETMSRVDGSPEDFYKCWLCDGTSEKLSIAIWKERAEASDSRIVELEKERDAYLLQIKLSNEATRKEREAGDSIRKALRGEALQNWVDVKYPKVCTHGEEPSYCDCCKHEWEQAMVAAKVKAEAALTLEREP